MQPLDLLVVERVIAWLEEGEKVWLCTVLSTFGSAPREPGSMMAALCNGEHIGSLSGGCVEDDFLQRLAAGEFNQACSRVLYGGADNVRERVQLPCDGQLSVLIELLQPTSANIQQLRELHATMVGQRALIRRVSLADGECQLQPVPGPGPKAMVDEAQGLAFIRVGPVTRLIIAGVSPVSVACADFAQSLGFEVIVCDPRPEVRAEVTASAVQWQPVMPSLFISQPNNCHADTAIVALTHDPRIDDLAMIEAVRTEAFYIGVMGSLRTSKARAARLRRSGGLNDQQIARITMPIGLNLGSRTPAEIALAVMADIIRVRRGIRRDAL
ncbi:XdhC family protein [Halioxenophilus sp. WMMB6]|uniref:XdhC family protein n=1 Tax=Halioxenophilus sp. WMMB6 TaxID=3073815 RepID=UPI00295F49EB|nr:XdhC family protein [Halioxenophilus sp. WMMB6]